MRERKTQSTALWMIILFGEVLVAYSREQLKELIIETTERRCLA